MSQTESSISRRDLLRKGAVAGAVAWTAPVVLSSPAFAASGKCSGSKPCTDFRSVKFEDGTSCQAAGEDGGCPEPDIVNCDGQAVTDFPSGCGDGITGSQSQNLGTMNIPAGIVPLVVHIKTGGNCYRITFNESGVPSAPTPAVPSGFAISVTGNPGDGYTVTATKNEGTPGAGVSHLTLYYCK